MRIFARRSVRSRRHAHQVRPRRIKGQQTRDEDDDERPRVGMVEDRRAAEVEGSARFWVRRFFVV